MAATPRMQAVGKSDRRRRIRQRGNETSRLMDLDTLGLDPFDHISDLGHARGSGG